MSISIVRASIVRLASSIAGGVAAWPIATLAQAVSSRLTPLSGNCRPGMNRRESLTASTTASSSTDTLWCFSSVSTIPRSIRQAISSVGSSTLTTWNRRASAASFSKYFLYSAQVVAAIVRSSPRASAGLSMLAASPCPAWPPAPISVWASSMKRMIGVGDFFTSSITPLSRFSNSPFTPAPACKRLRSSVRSETFFSGSGTSPSAIRWANPSTTAVLPTPASPVRIGLFCRRRVRMSMICRTSASRPRTGSILPAFARPVRSIVY